MKDYSSIEGMVRQSTKNPIMARDLIGNSDLMSREYGKAFPPACGKAFSRVCVEAIRINESPPRSTMQGSSQILRTKNGRLFIGRKSNSNASKSKAYFKKKLIPFSPKSPYEGALSIDILYNFKFNKTESKKNKERHIFPHIKRPDSDNLLKGLLDAMSDCNFWIDDSQLSEVHFSKNFSASPCLAVNLYSLMT